MKTKTVNAALYKHIRFGYEMILEGSGDTVDDCIRISEFQDIEFQVIESDAEKDAVKAIKVKAAQDRIDAAQSELDALL